mmetsp:Transcript_7897/g.18489  ORF Transcript_7897/g.18489 Transcript_7897/m.18489 type:complete len:282 (-) Transcript_7897:82-927(-)
MATWHRRGLTRARTSLVASFVWLFWLSVAVMRPVFAEDDAPDVQVEDAPSTEATPEEGQMSFEDSAQELKDKLNQLRDLLKARDGGIDPELMEKLGGLEAQLQGLGASLGLAGSPEARSLYKSCMLMSVMRAGATRKSVKEVLRQLASGELKQAQASSIDLVRMVATCINEITEEELLQAQTKSLGLLPKALVERSQQPEAAKQVEDLEGDVWVQLKALAQELEQELAESAGGSPVGGAWKIAMVPATIALFFLIKGFRAMMKRKGEVKKRKEKKEAKKQK